MLTPTRQGTTGAYQADTGKQAAQGSVFFHHNNMWREVHASFMPSQGKLLIDGVHTFLLRDIVACRHDPKAPEGFSDYGLAVVMRDGRTIHLATRG